MNVFQLLEERAEEIVADAFRAMERSQLRNRQKVGHEWVRERVGALSNGEVVENFETV